MAKTTDIRVVLIRCGRTDWDDAARLQGRTDLPLSESGREAVTAMIRELVLGVPEPAPATAYCGTDEASVETATVLAEACGAKVRKDDELIPMDLGIWDGLLEPQVLERFPSAYRQWKERPSTVNPPEGETFDDAESRLRRAVCRILEKANGKPVAIVLRPVPFGIVSCWLNQRPSDALWSVLDDGPQAERLTVGRQFIKDAQEALKARA